MGISGISPVSLLLIFLIVFLVFGKNRIKELAEELASAVKIFKKTLDDTQSPSRDQDPNEQHESQEAPRSSLNEHKAKPPQQNNNSHTHETDL